MPILSNLRNPVLVYIVFAIGLAFLLPSCYNTKSLLYMQGSFDTARLSQIRLPETKIQKGDILSITVYSDNSQASMAYNQGQTSPTLGLATAGSSGGATAGAAATTTGGGGGYWVDDQGYITFPGIGPLKIEGLTRDQLKDTLDLRLKEFLRNPYYNIRFQNKRITVLGEVAKPGIIPMSGDHMSLLEALSQAGDLNFYARRDNVLIIREKEGKREFARLDLTKPDILESPYFYLQQNDVMIVEPTAKKVAANDQITLRNIGIVSSVLSIVVIFITVFRK